MDQFKLVSRRRKGKGPRNQTRNDQVICSPFQPLDDIENDADLSAEKLKSKLKLFADNLKEDGFLRQVSYIFKVGGIESINCSSCSDDADGDNNDSNEQGSRAKFKEIVSYGIGNFSQSREALYQLALLVTLKDDHIITADDWFAFDPVFSRQEKSLLGDLGFRVMEENEKGARRVSAKTLFYMPHCPLPMYNNLLWANWFKAGLNNLVIFGTSFSSMADSFTASSDQQDYSHLFHTTKMNMIKEQRLKPTKEIYEAFNDTSVHFFSVTEEDADFRSLHSDDRPIYRDSVFARELVIS